MLSPIHVTSIKQRNHISESLELVVIPLKMKVLPSAELKMVSILESAHRAGSSEEGGCVVARGTEGKLPPPPPPMSVWVL